jgi:hypothetical protein
MYIFPKYWIQKEIDKKFYLILKLLQCNDNDFFGYEWKLLKYSNSEIRKGIMIVNREIYIIYPFEKKKTNCLTIIMEENNFTLDRCWLNEFEKTKSEINNIIDL